MPVGMRTPISSPQRSQYTELPRLLHSQHTLIRVYNEQGTIHMELPGRNSSMHHSLKTSPCSYNGTKAAQCVFRQQQHQLTPSAQSVSPLHPQGMSLLTFYFNSLRIAAIPFAVPSVVTAMNCAFRTVDLFVSCDCYNQQQLLP